MTEPEISAACRSIIARGTKPTLPEVRPLIDGFYALPGNCVGGLYLHAVLDDGNWQREFIESAIQRAAEDGAECAEWLARVLLLLSPSQRRRL